MLSSPSIKKKIIVRKKSCSGQFSCSFFDSPEYPSHSVACVEMGNAQSLLPLVRETGRGMLLQQVMARVQPEGPGGMLFAYFSTPSSRQPKQIPDPRTGPLWFIIKPSGWKTAPPLPAPAWYSLVSSRGALKFKLCLRPLH